MTWHNKRNIKKIKQWMNNKKITNEKMKEIQEQINTTVNKIINYNWHTQQNGIINEQIIFNIKTAMWNNGTNRKRTN